ncbi:MAG: DUF1351 domain-containing protein [Cetobacterium sp.]|uniref:DUF1351 domain-containing protein n=1 Tax=Cetobacterium sp. TaxID=2071632 RepID=UPI003EE6FE6A
MKEIMILGTEALNLKEVVVTPGKIDFAKEKFIELLDRMVESYEGLVVTEEEIKKFKQELANLRGFKKGIEDFRKEKKKAYSTPYDVFESDVKELTSKIDFVVNNINTQLDVFEEKRKAEKQLKIDEIKNKLIEKYAMDFNFIEAKDFLNATKTIKSITTELEEQIANYVKAENDRIEKERLIQEKKEMLEMLLETFQDKFELRSKIRYTEIEFLLDVSTSEIKETLQVMFQERKDNENEFDRIQAENEEKKKLKEEEQKRIIELEKEEVVEEVVETKEEVIEEEIEVPAHAPVKTKTVTIKFENMSLNQANELMQFIKDNGICYEVL